MDSSTHKENRDKLQLLLSKPTVINDTMKHDFAYLIHWLMDPPKITTYRTNKLITDNYNITKEINDILEKHKTKLSVSEIPEVTTIFDDTVIIGPWAKYDFCKGEKKEVIVDASCGVAILRGANVFAPGVMAMPVDVVIGERVNIFSDIVGQCRKGLKTELSSDGKYFVGDGIVKMTRNQIFKTENPSGIAIEVTMPVSMVPVIGQEIGGPGSCLLQNLPSIICSKVLDPQPGETILDMCAAPGNKTTHIAELMENKGILIALEKVISKIPVIEQKCRKHRITIVKCFACDSTKSVSSNDEHSLNDFDRGPPFRRQSFDRVLLDAPCSALGQRPLLKKLMTPKMIKSYVPLQRKLFHSAVELLKPGGRLVYSTCTVLPEENEIFVAWALQTFPCLKLTAAQPLLGGPGWSDCLLTDDQRLMVQRFGPEDDKLRETEAIYKDTIGFFIACFTKQ